MLVRYIQPHRVDCNNLVKQDDGVSFKPHPTGARFPAGYFEVEENGEIATYRVFFQRDGRGSMVRVKRAPEEQAAE